MVTNNCRTLSVDQLIPYLSTHISFFYSYYLTLRNSLPSINHSIEMGDASPTPSFSLHVSLFHSLSLYLFLPHFPSHSLSLSPSFSLSVLLLLTLWDTKSRIYTHTLVFPYQCTYMQWYVISTDERCRRVRRREKRRERGRESEMESE